MKCSCGAASVGGGCSSWCDSLIELPQLELPPEDDQDDPFIHFQLQGWPGPPFGRSIVAPKYFKLNIPQTQHTIEDAILATLFGMTITEDQMNDLKKRFPFHISINGGKETVNFVSQVFEEI